MIIVADSSPFVVLIAIGHVDVLSVLFTEILIPPQVGLELGSPKRPEAVRAFIRGDQEDGLPGEPNLPR